MPHRQNTNSPVNYYVGTGSYLLRKTTDIHRDSSLNIPEHSANWTFFCKVEINEPIHELQWYWLTSLPTVPQTLNCEKSLTALFVIIITYLFTSCLSLQPAKRPFGLRVKLPPVHLSTTHGGGFTLSLVLLNFKQLSREYKYLVFGKLNWRTSEIYQQQKATQAQWRFGVLRRWKFSNQFFKININQVLRQIEHYTRNENSIQFWCNQE